MKSSDRIAVSEMLPDLNTSKNITEQENFAENFHFLRKPPEMVPQENGLELPTVHNNVQRDIPYDDYPSPLEEISSKERKKKKPSTFSIIVQRKNKCNEGDYSLIKQVNNND